MKNNDHHLVDDVPRVINQMLESMLIESVQRGAAGSPAVSITRHETITQDNAEVTATLRVAMTLTVREK
jgi:hypothetical protein